MTAEEIIAEVRSIAEAMAVRDVDPGFISPSVQYRANDLLIRAGIPLGPWAAHRQYLTKPGIVILNGNPVEMQVHRAVVDDTVGEVCRAIVGGLMLADWQGHPEWKNWTPDRAEAAIREAAERLPELCDKLESLTPDLKPTDKKPDAKTLEEKKTVPSHLGLVFHHDSTVSRLGDDYKHVQPISMAPQCLKLLKFVHEAGERGRTKNEIVPEVIATTRILTAEKNRLNEGLIPIDIDLGGHGEYMVRCTKGSSKIAP